MLITLSVLFLAAGGAYGALLGPTPYKNSADSPFTGVSFSWFHLEDFEDHLLNRPGLTGNVGGVTSVVFGPSIHDSVDGDDGMIDGSGLLGDSYFSPSGSGGIRFSFDANVLGRLPTHAGVVWTDGVGPITFQAFGASGQPIGTVGPFSQLNVVPDSRVDGTTNEDRFFGVIDPAGISGFFIRNTGGGIEVDHIQYGAALTATAVPEPSPVALLVAGIAGILLLRPRCR